MAIMQPVGLASGVTSPQWQRSHVSAWVKGAWHRWSEPWRLAPYLEPLSAIERDIHGRSSATFRYHYGRGKREDWTTVAQWDPFALHTTMVGDRDLYVCIRVQPPVPGRAYVVWAGILPAEQREVYGTRADTVTGALQPAGAQVLTAQGFEYLLERRMLHGAAVVPPGESEEGETDYRFVTHVPAFNEGLPQGRQPAGNRSQYRINLPSPTRPATFGFGKDLDGAVPYRWSIFEIIAYLLFWSEADANYPTSGLNSEPHFALGASSPFSLLSLLNGLYPVLRAERRNVWEMLKELLDRRRGISAVFRWGRTGDGFPDGTRPIQIHAYSQTGTNLEVGGVTLPANRQRRRINIDQGIGIETAEVTVDGANTYDRIVVQGARVQSCFSAAVHAEGGLAGEMHLARLSPAWETDDDIGEEADYEAADDAERRREALQRVYRVFRLGGELGEDDEEFTWQTEVNDEEEPREVLNPAVVNPMYDQMAQMILTPGPYGNLNCRMLKSLPLPHSADVVALEAEQARFMVPFAVVRLPDPNEEVEWSDQWAEVSDPPSPDDDLDADRLTPTMDVSADVTPQDRGLEIDVHFRQGNHVLGLNHFDPADGKESAVEPEFDYEQMIVTVAVETENRPTIEVPTGVTSNRNSRTLVIIVPEAHLWLVAPGTITGLNADGSLIRYAGPQVVRDDTALLRATAARARVLFGQARASLVLRRRGLLDDYEIGTFLTARFRGAATEEVGNVIAAREFDFEEQTTMMRTGHLELEVRR